MNRAMTATEQERFDKFYNAVDEARTIMENVGAGLQSSDEDLRVACARLDEWLLANHKRWSA